MFEDRILTCTRVTGCNINTALTPLTPFPYMEQVCHMSSNNPIVNLFLGNDETGYTVIRIWIYANDCTVNTRHNKVCRPVQIVLSILFNVLLLPDETKTWIILLKQVKLRTFHDIRFFWLKLQWTKISFC